MPAWATPPISLRIYVSEALDELDYRCAVKIVEEEDKRAAIEAEREYDARGTSAAERIRDSFNRRDKSVAIDAKCAELAADRESLTTSEKDKLGLGLRILLSTPRE